MMIQPARLTFWRWVLGVTSFLAWLSMREAFLLAGKLGLAPLASKTWLALLGAQALISLISLSLLLSFTARRGNLQGLLAIVDYFPDRLRRARGWARWPGHLLLLALLAAYPLIVFLPYYGNLLAGQAGMRLFLFWLLSLAGAQALRLALPNLQWPAALLSTILLQASLQRVLIYLPDISAYPFAMGWSETSRFYYPALFLSQKIFGQSYPWPVLHPSLHFLLAPPYLLAAPLWFHRLWQVAVRFLLVGLIAPALIRRLGIDSPERQAGPITGAWRWLGGLWIFLVLFSLPLYLHLAVPVLILLWGFSAKNERRTWFWLLLASIWAGLSRLNWYPMPGMLAAALYFLEVPLEKKGWSYLVKPALWFAVSTVVAFVSMQIYIALSGTPNPGDFFTSLSSALLWERLWPNASYSLGVLPGIVLFSAPFWLAIYDAWRRPVGRGSFRLAQGLLLAELLVLFMGGIVVSMKIGGGADIHNMDAYAVLLVVITVYLLWGREPGQMGSNEPTRNIRPAQHWTLVALLVLVPAWFSVQSQASFWRYNPAASRAALAALQQQVDKVNASGGEILFITQRHLISMDMLTGVRLVPEYEREELMEMAMAQNDVYLETFRADLEKHRFAAIVVDPLRFNFVGEKDAMGAENNAWTRHVVKKILCNYQQAAIFPADRIAIYEPQSAGQNCP